MNESPFLNDDNFFKSTELDERGFLKSLPKEKEGGAKSAPKGYPKQRKEYADPKNFSYPLDTEKHVRAAISYFSMPKNASKYSAEEQKSMWTRMKRAAKKYGIELSEKAGPSSVEKEK